MNKQEFLELVKQSHEQHEQWYIDNGPNKRDQEEYYDDGYNVVRMNVGLLEGWLDHGNHGQDLNDEFQELSATDRREIWEASGFKFGIYGFTKDDADTYWARVGITNRPAVGNFHALLGVPPLFLNHATIREEIEPGAESFVKIMADQQKSAVATLIPPGTRSDHLIINIATAGRKDEMWVTLSGERVKKPEITDEAICIQCSDYGDPFAVSVIVLKENISPILIQRSA